MGLKAIFSVASPRTKGIGDQVHIKASDFLSQFYPVPLFKKKKKNSFFKVYLFFERERDSMWGRAERGRHGIWSRLQGLSCQRRDWLGAQTHEPWDHHLSRSQRLNRLSHPGAPPSHILNSVCPHCLFYYCPNSNHIIRALLQPPVSPKLIRSNATVILSHLIRIRLFFLL